LLAGAALPASMSAYAQCVTDTMVVDACLGGVRRTVPQGMTLSLDFMRPGNMPVGITFTRASTAQYTDINGVTQTAAVNQPCWDYDPVTHALRGLLIDAASGPRAQDNCAVAAPGGSSWFVSPGGTWLAEFIPFTNGAGQNGRLVGLTPGGAAPLYINTSSNVAQYDGVGFLANGNTIAANVVMKAAASLAGTTGKNCLNGGAVVSAGGFTTGYGLIGTNGVTLMGTSNPPDVLSGYLRRVQYWPRALSDAEMQGVTA
jgi:hypothetical protein